jgi:hypothetical protein
MTLRSFTQSLWLVVLAAPCLSLIGLPCSGLLAAGPAITDPAQVDATYAWIGEYTSAAGGEKVGVRVSVRDGDQPLFARLYPGGLPGLGWGTADPEVFSGSLGPQGLQLTADKNPARTIRSAPTGGIVLVDAHGRVTALTKISRRSMTLGKAPPRGAQVLFDGTAHDHWKNAKVTEDGLLGVGAETVAPLGGGYLHVEFRTPYMPTSSGQNRGNSGIYLQRRYEIQILDSFALAGIENECGALYRQRKPDLNMALPPLVWQTYDIFFEPATFSSDGQRLRPTQLTVIHNGVPVHYRNMVKDKTGAGKPEGPEPLPLWLQDHGDPVFFRNIWFVPASTTSTPRTQSGIGGGSVASPTATRSDRLTALFAEHDLLTHNPLCE